MSNVANLRYRPDVGRVIERHREWMDPHGGARCLVTVVPGEWNSYNWDLSIGIRSAKPLEEYDFTDEDQLHEHLDFRLAQIKEYWQRKLDWNLDDDMIPVFEPRLGWAEGPATCVDAPVEYYAQTSNLKPVIEDYKTFDWERICFRPDLPAGQVLQRAIAYSLHKAEGRFLVQPRGETVNPSDLAKACRGDALFMDFHNAPDDVRHLIECCGREATRLIEHVRGLVGQTAGGYVTSWSGGYWTPGSVLGHVGDNVSDLISPATYEEFIAPCMRSFSEHFGGIIFARDVTSKQIWEVIPRLGSVRAFKPRKMGSVDVTPGDIRQIAAKTEKIPLFLEPFSFQQFQQFREVAEELHLKVFFVVHCRNRDEGLRIIEAVRRMS